MGSKSIETHWQELSVECVTGRRPRAYIAVNLVNSQIKTEGLYQGLILIMDPSSCQYSH